ncbi:hypothetical protein BC1002_6577 [Paraburkholderia atlantica]|uniref:Uncharacterized protein n=1 Tax=Paraburkholderia atlantica TaxID=2654982 RepID=D5WMH2_PARAM|nr:hypothetical protein BC1002_6577 [Paraburkholderia atlantica]
MSHIRYPDAATDRPCRFCEHWGGDIAGGSHALCVRGGAWQVQANPERGCVYWIRAVGTDDDATPSDPVSIKKVWR